MRTKTKSLLLAFLFPLTASGQENKVTQCLLPTLENGPWPCCYYLLNSNDEQNSINAKDWAGRCVNEEDWAFGYGPLSNSHDLFLTTYWGSERQPLLLRRHFTLTAEDMAALAQGTLTLACSYDENPRFYLNGSPLFSFTGWNDNDYAQRTLTSRHKALLREGDNVLAVSLMAGNGGGHIDFGLTMTRIGEQSSINEVHSQTSLVSSIYDLSGRRLPAPPETGLYIQDKQKFIKSYKD